MVPAPVKEACLKLAAMLIVDRQASLRLSEGEGISFPVIRTLIAPYINKAL